MTICEYCKSSVNPVVYGGFNTGGMRQVVKKCPNCKQNVKKGQAFYPVSEYEFDFLPILYDERSRYKCEVIGCENNAEEGTMIHHNFPKHIFGKDLAERAPKSRLCKTHHIDHWHKQLTPNMSRKDID